jgi:single-strand selective monofunctional uracil DNA glycosylase
VVGVGGFAEQRARDALTEFEGTIGGMLHPSPANPRANRDWARHAEADLRRLGIVLAKRRLKFLP